MAKKNDPDGPLHKWGEPEGTQDFINKTPGQKKKEDVKEMKLRTDVKPSEAPKLSAAAKKKLRKIAKPTDMSDMKKTIKVGSRMEEVDQVDENYEEKDMAQRQLHFIQYAAEEIIDYCKMNPDMEEWFQNKLSAVHDQIRQLHSYIEGDKRMNDMGEEVELDEASLKMKIAARGKIESKLLNMKNDDAKMAAFLINQDDQKELAKFLKSLDSKSRKAIEDVMKEEVDQVNELDSKTYRSYIDKATQSQLKTSAKKKLSDKEKHTARKRSLGIATAQLKQYGDKRTVSQRIKNEEVEQVDEVYPPRNKKEAEMQKQWGKAVSNDLKNQEAKLAQHKKDVAAALKAIRTRKEEVELDEKLDPSMGAGEYVKDFRDSDAPQFKGKSMEKRQKMAIAAYLSAKRKQQDEAYKCKSKKKMKKEEVEQVDELKKSTLQSYMKKAGKKAPATNKSMRHYVGAQDRLQGKFYHKGSKVDKDTGEVTPSKYRAESFELHEEEVEQVDEARGYKVPSNYAAMMAKKRKKAGTSEFSSHPDKKNQSKVDKVDMVGRSNSRNEETELDEAKYGDTGWRKMSGSRKDKYGNTVKNVAKHLAKKGLSKAQDKHLDVHDDDKIDAKDFAKLRNMKKNK